VLTSETEARAGDKDSIGCHLLATNSHR